MRPIPFDLVRPLYGPPDAKERHSSMAVSVVIPGLILWAVVGFLLWRQLGRPGVRA